MLNQESKNEPIGKGKGKKSKKYLCIFWHIDISSPPSERIISLFIIMNRLWDHEATWPSDSSLEIQLKSPFTIDLKISRFQKNLC